MEVPMRVPSSLGLFAMAFWTWSLFTGSPSLAYPEEPKPKVKTGEVKENQRYENGNRMFSVTVPAARNPFVKTYKFFDSQLKQGTADYGEVVFHIDDFGQSYGAGVHRIPQEVL